MSSGDQWWKEDLDSEERIQEMLDKSEENRIRREEELEQAKHDVKIAELEKREREANRGITLDNSTNSLRTIDEDSKSTEIHDGGILGIWWLSSGEAVAIGLGGVFLIITIIGGIMAISNSDSFEEVNGEIVGKYPGWKWIENEECFDDGYCSYYYDLECYVDLNIQILGSLNQNWSNYAGNPESVLDGYIFRSDGNVIANLGDYDGAEQDCLDYGLNETFELGSTITLFYNTENPMDIRISDPLITAVSTSAISGGCCLTIFLVLILNSRFSNAPMVNTDLVSDKRNTNDGDVHIHHHHGITSRFGFARKRGHRRRNSRIISRNRRNSQRQRNDGGGRSGGGRR